MAHLEKERVLTATDALFYCGASISISDLTLQVNHSGADCEVLPNFSFFCFLLLFEYNLLLLGC